MAQRSHVPKFGNWESEENVPYTAYFDKARKGRTAAGKITNPNDPQENPDMLSDYGDQNRAPPARAKEEQDEPSSQAGARRAYDYHRSREEGELKQFADSPARHENMNRRGSGDSTPSRYGRGVAYGEAHKRPVRTSIGSENSIERSPLHHHARISGTYDGSHGTPGRSRVKQPRGDESPEQGAAVPKFGDWDENNPASADGYTHIFNKVREERNNGGRVPGMPAEQKSPYHTVRKQGANNRAKFCCFPWGCK